MTDQVALVTGASRGLGRVIARALARRGATVALAARSREGLDEVVRLIEAEGGAAVAFPVDLGAPGACLQLIDDVRDRLGPVDLLINNAALVEIAAYPSTRPDAIEQMIAVNLTAPMMLSRAVLPEMLARDRGHIVNVASLAGLIGVGWGEVYTATKHGLVGFTRSLRLSARLTGSQVSASVVCPGFIDESGMYADLSASTGARAPLVFGTITPKMVTQAVLRAIDDDVPQIIVNQTPVRPLCGVLAILPRLGERLTAWLGTHRVFREVIAAHSGQTEWR